jgi:ribosome-associated protein
MPDTVSDLRNSKGDVIVRASTTGRTKAATKAPAKAKASSAKKKAAPATKPVAAKPAAPKAPRPAKAKAPAVPSSELLKLMLAALDDNKAEDVVTIPLAGKSSVADHLIVATGRSTRQVATMAQHLRDQIKATGRKAPAVEGLQQADWVLVDAGDIVAHLFRPEIRALYNLEKMWTADLTPNNVEGQAKKRKPGAKPPSA